MKCPLDGTRGQKLGKMELTESGCNCDFVTNSGCGWVEGVDLIVKDAIKKLEDEITPATTTCTVSEGGISDVKVDITDAKVEVNIPKKESKIRKVVKKIKKVLKKKK